MKTGFRDNKFIRFLIVFAAVFCACYFGALFLTGIAVPGGHYSPFIDKYFDIASWMRRSLLSASQLLLDAIGTETYRPDEYILRATNGGGIRLVYSCLGFGVMSFWAAFTIASDAAKKKKLLWLFGGLLVIWLINVLRISLVLQAAHTHSLFPFGWNHHTWFNIVAYGFIFGMIFFFERGFKRRELKIKD